MSILRVTCFFVQFFKSVGLLETTFLGFKFGFKYGLFSTLFKWTLKFTCVLWQKFKKTESESGFA